MGAKSVFVANARAPGSLGGQGSRLKQDAWHALRGMALLYAGRVSSAASAGEDSRVWVGRVLGGHEAEHARFLEWLNGPEAAEVFRRRRLTEYLLSEDDGAVMVVFKAHRTGDPRIMIDFLRYPGLWPDYWEFVRGGRLEDEPATAPRSGTVKVHWRRSDADT
jgi:hypothetical protein